MIQSSEVRLRAIIVDDEIHGRENLKTIIDNYCPEIAVEGTADSVINAKKLVADFNPDVVFLDINMPVLDGFDFLGEYDDRRFMVVFISAYEDYGIKALKAGAIDYLLKPISIKELKQTVKKLINAFTNLNKEKTYLAKDKIIVPASHGFNIISVDDIIQIKAEGSYSRIFINSGKNIIVSRTLKDFEDTLPEEKFFRSHKSYLINFAYVKEYSNIDGGFVYMTDGSKVEISRRKAAEFIQKIRMVINAV